LEEDLKKNGRKIRRKQKKTEEKWAEMGLMPKNQTLMGFK